MSRLLPPRILPWGTQDTTQAPNSYLLCSLSGVLRRDPPSFMAEADGNTQADRIRYLPDDILIHILSFLPNRPSVSGQHPLQKMEVSPSRHPQSSIRGQSKTFPISPSSSISYCLAGEMPPYVLSGCSSRPTASTEGDCQ